MKFDEALKHIYAGEKVRRKKWIDDYCVSFNEARQQIIFIIHGREQLLIALESIAADDWEVVETLMTFQEAVEAMKQGKKCRCKSWKNPEYIICLTPSGHFLRTGDSLSHIINLSDIEAKDWVVA